MSVNIQLAEYANPVHQKQLMDLMQYYSRDTMGGGQPLAEFTRANLLSALANIPTAFSILATCEGNPAGLVNCFEGFSTFACRPLINIHDVIVKSEHRGQNISQLMLKQVELIARQRGACKLTLEVLQGNQIAQNAYGKYGFSAYQLGPPMGHALFWEKKLSTRGTQTN